MDEIVGLFYLFSCQNSHHLNFIHCYVVCGTLARAAGLTILRLYLMVQSTMSTHKVKFSSWYQANDHGALKLRRVSKFFLPSVTSSSLFARPTLTSSFSPLSLG